MGAEGAIDTGPSEVVVAKGNNSEPVAHDND